MWTAINIAIIAPVVLFLLPWTRPVVVWLIYVPMALWVVRFRWRIRAGYAPELIAGDDPRITEACRVAMDHASGEVRSLGFEECGLFALDRGPGQPLTIVRVLANVPARATASVGCVIQGSSIGAPSVGFGTRAVSGQRTVTTTEGTPGSVEAPGVVTMHVPSLRAPADLWTAHRALCDRGSGVAAEVPATDAERVRSELAKEAAEELGRLCAAGLMKARRDGSLRYTWRGALVWGTVGIWPRRQRIAARVRAEEERLMAEVGLTAMLERARAGAPAEPSPERGVARLNDDRGRARVIARVATGRGDERFGDPRFRALLAQSELARQSAFNSNVKLAAAIVIPGMVAMTVAGLPAVLAIFVPMVAMLVVFMLVNRNRMMIAEKAAAGVLLRRGLCASCLYPLGGLTVESDGCLVCPECGAAWKRDRISEFDKFASGSDSDGVMVGRVTGAVATYFAGGPERGMRGKDHLGARCALVSSTLRNHIGAATETTRARLIAARAQMRRSGRAMRIVAALVIGLMSLGIPLLVAGPALLRAPVGRATEFFLMWTVLSGASLVLWVFRGNLGCGVLDVIRAMLDQRLCPSCGESLDGREPGEDGITRCVCGCGWRARRTTATAPIDAGVTSRPEVERAGTTIGGPS